jgi:O-antigen/teichoic acid export membrane protein
MFRNRFLTDVSISTAQVILNQLTGIVVFFIITGYLDKASLGHINWAMALLTVVLSILGFGLEHIAVRKAATGEDIGSLLQSYLAHAIIATAGLLLLVWLAGFRFVWMRNEGNFFFWLTLAQCIGFIAIPFRHIANGLEKFRAFFLMSSASNMVKLVLLLVLAVFYKPGLRVIVFVYLFASIAELVVCVFIYRIKLALPLRVGFSRRHYLLLVKEALPQLGITVFNTAMARMDWILLGRLSTSVMVADYSVTNKIFELSTLPLLVIAPVIFPKISRMFSANVQGDLSLRVDYLKMLLKLEIIVAVYIAMAINLCWKDVLDTLTANKYGASTVNIIFIMSFAMPLLYINHIFWSILFAQQRMRQLLLVFLFSFLVNFLADLLLIPVFQANGAALGYLLALLTQSLMYSWFVQINAVRRSALQLIPIMLGALACGLLSDILFDFFVWKLVFATTGFLLLLALTGQLRYTHWQQAKQILAT